ALVQRRHGGDGVTVVIGGDAGTAEGDFTSCMVWATRPGMDLPVLMVVTNNGYGISTPAKSQHAERTISDRGEPFGIPGEEADAAAVVATAEPMPTPDDVERFTYAPSRVDAVYPDDYTGLPR